MSDKAHKHRVDHRPKEAGAKRIAVVAIHGVGDHPQFATAREIGDLLSNLEYKPSGTPRYSPFTEVTKRISVRPVKVGQGRDVHLTRQKNTWGPLDSLAKSVWRGSARPKDEDNSVESLDHLFMKGQLVGYKEQRPEDTYQCLRLEGKRLGDQTRASDPPATAPESRAREPGPAHAGDATGRESDQAPAEPQAEPQDEAQEKIVHVYEMYWADLSQLGNAVTRIFGELYQLLFHLGSLSVNSVLVGAIHFQGNPQAGKKWRWFARAQGLAAAVLAWPIPILNLYMAAMIPPIIAVSLMRSHLSAQGESIVLDLLAGVLCLAGCGFLLAKRRTFPEALFRLPLFLTLLGAGAICARFLSKPLERNVSEAIVATIAVGLSLAVVRLVINAYDARRPGSKAAAVWTGIVLAATMIPAFSFGGGFPIGGPVGYPVIGTCLNILEIAFGLLTASGVAFYFAYILAHLAGWWAVRSVGGKNIGNPEYAKASQTRWTAQLILALSSMIFVSVTVAAWTGIVKVVVQTLPGQENVDCGGNTPCVCASESDDGCKGRNDPVRYQPLGAMIYRYVWNNLGLGRLDPAGGEKKQPALALIGELERRAVSEESPRPASEWAGPMLLAGGLVFLPLFLFALLLTLLITLWSLALSISGELNPPGATAARDADDACAAAKMASQSASFGIWLDRGFRFMRPAGEIIYWAMWLPTVVVVLFNFSFVELIYRHPEHVDAFIGVVGTVVGGTAIGVLGFAGRLKNVAGGMRTALRVMLDVDNWLREHPRDSNPTARICGRYVSLLRHISAWRDSDGESQYDAIVIIAHSQGTVITADFLRFLNAEKRQAGSMANYDRELELFDKLPVFFFTMGCPLRQLYGLRFPYLYDWARNEIPAEANDIDAEATPRPDRLRVRRWVNAYRSGDYIGRYLWRADDSADKWDPRTKSADAADQRTEFCIGPGAHTHYWDHTADAIAKQLDELIETIPARNP